MNNSTEQKASIQYAAWQNQCILHNYTPYDIFSLDRTAIWCNTTHNSNSKTTEMTRHKLIR